MDQATWAISYLLGRNFQAQSEIQNKRKWAIFLICLGHNLPSPTKAQSKTSKPAHLKSNQNSTKNIWALSLKPMSTTQKNQSLIHLLNPNNRSRPKPNYILWEAQQDKTQLKKLHWTPKLIYPKSHKVVLKKKTFGGTKLVKLFDSLIQDRTKGSLRGSNATN